MLLTKGKFLGGVGKIVSSDDTRHRIYLLDSDMSKCRKKPYDYLKSTCFLLPETAKSASRVEDLQALLSPSELALFVNSKSNRSLPPSQDGDATSCNSAAPSKPQKNHGGQDRW